MHLPETLLDPLVNHSSQKIKLINWTMSLQLFWCFFINGPNELDLNQPSILACLTLILPFFPKEMAV